jgi:hypothetical protein
MRRMVKKAELFGMAVCVAAGAAACFSACSFPFMPDSTLPAAKEITVSGANPVSYIDFSDVSQSITVHLKDLKNQSVYLVKYAAVSATAKNTGYAVSSGVSAQRQTVQEAISGVFTAADGSTGIRYDHLAAQQFNHNPPPPSAVSRTVTGERRASKVYTENGTAGRFWVESDSTGKGWEQKPATLRATGSHTAVWVADENFTTAASSDNDNKITRTQAKTLASTFDVIYEKETPIFGYEYGGGPSGNGGQDGDDKIQILIFDIDKDYKQDQTSGVFGYFWAKDFYTQNEIAGGWDGATLKTNYAEIFYLDAHLADKFPDGAVSTLTHEFQHMINFNEKSVKSDFKQTSETWFDEMLAMLAEDLIDPFLGITEKEFPYNQRIPLFLNAYAECAPIVWNSENVLYSYANSYAFGAYLARNFGGASLLQKIMTNAKANSESVVDAVNSEAVHGSNWTFPAILSRFGEALVFSGNNKPSGVFSFDTTVTRTINGMGYTFSGFDIWRMDNPFAGERVFANVKDTYPSHGPFVLDTKYSLNMPANTFIVQSNEAWQDITDTLTTITLNKPASQAVAFFIMIR